jgi:putative sterol carrier protein
MGRDTCSVAPRRCAALSDRTGGGPLIDSAGVERARPPDDILPAHFFLNWVPDAVARDPDRQRRLGDLRARVVFELSGAEGGVYTVEIEQGRVRAREGGSDDPDLHVRLDVDTWRSLNRGELSAPEALLRRKLHFTGSFLLGLKLHLILG